MRMYVIGLRDINPTMEIRPNGKQYGTCKGSLSLCFLGECADWVSNSGDKRLESCPF